jgi:transcriptional regulator with XRE-family HTH domain
MRAADLVREARLRAGLTQDELSRISGTPRSVIARWEQGAVQPGFDNMLDVIQACGFDLPLIVVVRDTTMFDRLERNRLLSPEHRVERYLSKLDRESGAAST